LVLPQEAYVQLACRNAFVAFWTVGAVASGGVLFALFSLPFWFAGATLARQTALSALLRETLILDDKDYALKQELARVHGGAARFVGGGLRRGSGAAADLRGAKARRRPFRCACTLHGAAVFMPVCPQHAPLCCLLPSAPGLRSNSRSGQGDVASPSRRTPQAASCGRRQ
jgi:hypothetical protein